jgi:hypothetical protein
MYLYTVLGKGMTHTGNLLVKRNTYLGTRWTYDYLTYCCQSYTNKCHCVILYTLINICHIFMFATNAHSFSISYPKRTKDWLPCWCRNSNGIIWYKTVFLYNITKTLTSKQTSEITLTKKEHLHTNILDSLYS